MTSAAQQYMIDSVMTDLMLMATLLGGPTHGYALKKTAGLILGQADIHNNVVYPLLRRFVENGWASKRSAAGNAARPAKFMG